MHKNQAYLFFFFSLDAFFFKSSLNVRYAFIKPGSKPTEPVNVFFFFFPTLGLFFFKLPIQPCAVAFKSNLKPPPRFLVLRFNIVRACDHSKNHCFLQSVFKYSDIKTRLISLDAKRPKNK